MTDQPRTTDPTHGQAETAAREMIGRPTESETQRLQSALESRARAVRLYTVLIRANEAVLRCREEQELHERVCSILVEVGGYPLAWIGRPQGDRVVPTVACGSSADYVREISVTVDGEFGKGPTGTSIREGRAVVNQDFLAEMVMGPWRERAMQHGFRSSAAFPLRRNGTVIASLTLYSSEPSAFDAEHTELLEALAAKMSYAHDAMEDERLRGLAEESLARSEAKLRDADERKNEFLAVLSHELRNPLAPIKNSLHILDRASPGGEQALRAQRVIERQIEQLTRLVDDLLDMTRVTRGKLRMERARLDLVDVVGRSAEDRRQLFEAADILFDVTLPAYPLWIFGDAVRLAQVVGNLLTNAAKFTPRGGRVVLSVGEAPAGIATIRVRDTGVGIPKQLLGHLFEPFRQAEATIDHSKAGLGLGLALVKGLVEMHGGSAEARSEGLGFGAELIVTLPIDGGPRPSLTDGDVASSQAQPRRVLVIEDNVDAAITLQEALMLAGHTVEVAYNGSDGIEKARVFAPEVVICDLHLPGMHGYDVADAFRSDETLRTVTLVAHSGDAQPEDIPRATAAGFHAYLRKPASMVEIEQVLARSQPPLGDLVQKAKSPALERELFNHSTHEHAGPENALGQPSCDNSCASLKRRLGRACHDLSTPLATLSLSLQNAHTRLQKGEAIDEETVRKALKHVDEMATVIREVVEQTNT